MSSSNDAGFESSSPAMSLSPWSNRILVVGFGSIGQGVLPLIFRRIDVEPSRVTILTPEDRETEARAAGVEYGVNVIIDRITQSNYATLLEPLLSEGDFIINVSVEVCSWDIMRWCQGRGVLYIDTVAEPWPGGYDDPSRSVSARSNYMQRENVLALRREFPAGTTAISCHGANPGLVSHFVKQALLNIARDTEVQLPKIPETRAEWAALAQLLGVKTIHIAERDTQVSSRRKVPGEFVNTWSVEGFIGEGRQPAELGWGTHEKALPADGARHESGCDAAIYLNRPGASTKVRTWTPMAGAFHGFLITHNESISIADFLTVVEGGAVTYRPTVHYAYHPCDDAVVSVHELAGSEFTAEPEQRLMRDDIVSGVDELGVLLMGHKKNAYWYGSQLDIKTTRDLVNDNNATSLQVNAAIIAGVLWAMRNPDRGILESEDLPFQEILDVAMPYIQPVVGEYSEWTPLRGRQRLFAEPQVDCDDPFQFANFRVL